VDGRRQARLIAVSVDGRRQARLIAVSVVTGVTIGWLLRLVTGAPLVVGGPDSSILF